MAEVDPEMSICSACGCTLPTIDAPCPDCGTKVPARADSAGAQPAPLPRLLRVAGPAPLQPLHVVLIALIAVAVGGGLMLLSTREPTGVVDGAIDWKEESWLRAVVKLLCLNYQMATLDNVAIKDYVLGIAAGLALLAVGIAVATRSRTEDEETLTHAVGLAQPGGAPLIDRNHTQRTHIAPLVAAQVLLALYLLWSFASSRWSLAPDLSVGASILLAIYLLWALALGIGLGAKAAVAASRIVIILTVITAGTAVWYHYGRKPTMRIDFPVGNPIFLAACLLPGLMLSVGMLCENLRGPLTARRAVLLALSVLAIGLIGWAFALTGSRGPLVGLAFGALAMAFFALRGRLKLAPVGLAVVLAAVGYGWFASAAETFSPSGRDATLRLRMYAWQYAFDMFLDSPFKGNGQGGFVLTGDSHAVGDVLKDPQALEARLAHAHNEWLEVMADLGSVGIVLLIAAYLLTFHAGAAALERAPPPEHRWALIALLGAFVGLSVEECANVGLRVAGTPTLFYTTLGLVWALSSDPLKGVARSLSITRARRILTGLFGGTLGLAALVVTQRDFTAARQGYRAEVALRNGDLDEAIRLSTLATDRLNTQRALLNLERLAAAHLRAAQDFQAQALDRERRALETDPPNPVLLRLANEGFGLSNEQCELGSGALKELVRRSPRFINHGHLQCWLTLTRVGNIPEPGAADQQAALFAGALIALERELERQPFNVLIAVDYVRVAAPRRALSEYIEAFVRPLRHHRLDQPYVDLLSQLLSDDAFRTGLDRIVQEAALRATAPFVGKAAGEPVETWAPEKLRLGATVRFMSRDYRGARDLLVIAARAYDRLAASAPLGAASCYDELGLCQFYSDPTKPERALYSASRALATAGDSTAGKKLKRGAKVRVIDYLIAAGQEEPAKALLHETAPTTVTEEGVLRELGSRYRRLCETLTERTDVPGILRKPPPELLAKFLEWIDRAVTLDPTDPRSDYLAGHLRFLNGEDEPAADHLRRALTNGLPKEMVLRFLEFAQTSRPDSEPLASLRNLLATGTAPTPPVPDRAGAKGAAPSDTRVPAPRLPNDSNP